MGAYQFLLHGIIQHEKAALYNGEDRMSFMNRKELLKKYYDLETHNALCYSENLLMTKPKKGYEKEWKEV